MRVIAESIASMMAPPNCEQGADYQIIRHPASRMWARELFSRGNTRRSQRDTYRKLNDRANTVSTR